MGGRGSGGGGRSGGPQTPAQAIAARIERAATSTEARAIVEGLSKAELIDVLAALGSRPREGSKATRGQIIDDIAATVTIRNALSQGQLIP